MAPEERVAGPILFKPRPDYLISILSLASTMSALALAILEPRAKFQARDAQDRCGANIGNCGGVFGQEGRSKNAPADSLAYNGGEALGRWGIAARFRRLARLLRERRAAYTIPFAAGRKLSAKL